MKNHYEKNLNLMPKYQAIYDFNSLVLKYNTKLEDIIKFLENSDLKTFNEFYFENFKNKKEYKFNKFYNSSNNMFENNDLKFKTFFYGNYDNSTAIKIYNNIINNFFSFEKNNFNIHIQNIEKINLQNSQNSNYLPEINNLHADLSGYNIFRRQLYDNHNHDHAILNFYQIGSANYTNLLYINIIKKVVGYIYFTELRIKEQLGYSCKGGVLNRDNILYFVISVQGSRITPDEIDQKIENVIFKMREKVSKVNLKKLKKIKQSVINWMGKKDLNLKSRAFRIWDVLNSQINSQNFNIRDDFRKFIITKEKLLNKKNILYFFDNVFTKNLRKLSIQEFSKNVLIKQKRIRDFKIMRGNGTLKYEPLIIENDEYFKIRSLYYV
jgi:secreted Zn-dependent insulinase-like peptidase